MELLDYEKRHIDYLLDNAHECTLFLKRNGEFPIDKPCNMVLVGNGARNTIKGGTGSGDVASRFFASIEDAFKESGFNVTSCKWMDEYDAFRKSSKKDYIKDAKKKARKAHIFSFVYSMGFFEEEKNYDIDCNFDGDICLYILSRNSGEGNDRRNIKGDVKLSDKEVNDILFLNHKFKKFMLVLNVGGVVDLSPVMEVGNILLLSQLGVVTSNTLVDIVLGKVNPSGKLSTTWAKPEDYPCFNEFGGQDDTYYKEGIYVGYRYFSTLNKEALFPFGYGLSYTDFSIDVEKIEVDKFDVDVYVNVKNIGKYLGKEVVEGYVTKPNNRLDNPYLELGGYVKTKKLLPNESEIVKLHLNLLDLWTYDEKEAAKLLLAGSYIIRIGNSSANLKAICKCELDKDLTLEKLNNKCTCQDIKDLIPDYLHQDNYDDLLTFKLDYTEFISKEVVYQKDEYVDPLIEKLSDESLVYMCCGNFSGGIADVVGASSHHVVGGAGETTLKVPEVKEYLTMADGPAGLRLKQEYGIDKKGVYDLSMDPMMEKMLDFIPKLSRPFIVPKKNRHGEIHHQYTTAIPIGTALAQSFNDELVTSIARLVAEEMKIFNVDLWLAPALNIHRNILCGRNFEYFSEDPLLSGKMASNITKGIEENKELGVTIKHFAANNQEFNRNNNNSHISERALREIYLKGFEYCIKESNPKAIMTSYNLINGIHTSESFELVNDILRCEWHYEGLVMTDWIQSGRSLCSKSKYRAPYASKNVKAGNDLTMSGSKKDYHDIMKALKRGIISRDDLVYSASRIYRSILKQKGN